MRIPQNVIFLLGWQCCSLLVTATGVFSQLLAARGVNVPTTQSVANYLLLSTYLLRWSLGRGRSEPSALRPWQWLLLAIVDVEANYLLVLAYQYTDITSVTLLDGFTVPCVMVLSRGLFGRRFSRRQLFGVMLCLGGLAVLVATDASHGNTQQAKQPLLGDALVLAGAALYACRYLL